MIFKKRGILRWSVAAMATLIAFAIGCGNSSVDGNLIDPTYPEILSGNTFIQQNRSATRESILGGSSAERSKASQDDESTQNSVPILQVSGTPEPTSTPKPPVAEPVSVSADSSPSDTGDTTESSVTKAPVLIAAEQSSTTITFSLVSAADSSSIGHGEPVFISVMIDAGDHDVRGVEVALKYDPNMLSVLNLETGDFLVDETFEFIDPVVGLRSIDDKAGLIEFAAAKIGDRPLSIKSGELVRIVGIANKNLVTDDNLLSLSSVRVAGASGNEVGFIVGGVDLQGWQ